MIYLTDFINAIDMDFGADDFDLRNTIDDDPVGLPFESLGEISIQSSIDPDSDLLRGLQDTLKTEIAGIPWVNAFFWAKQTLGSNCSVAVQTGILKMYGFHVPEILLSHLAIEKGWLTSEGATFEDCGKVLEYFGIKTHTHLGATFDDILNELHQGHAVIVPLDSGEIWADNFLSELWEYMEDILGIPDHVVWVTGIDMTDPNDPQIIVNDTGHPDGAGRHYSLSEFADAWEDANFSYIATNAPPPNYDSYISLEELWQDRG